MWTSLVVASGFSVPAQTGSMAGSAFAGPAEAPDASAIWFNPATATSLGTNVAIAATFLRPSFRFSNQGSTGAFAPAGSGDGGNAGHDALVPAHYGVTDVGNGWHLGLGLNAPFGLKTEYDADWRGRFAAQRSEARTVNVNPIAAYQLSDGISIGAGIDWQHLVATLTNFAGPAGDAYLRAQDQSWGYNVGAMFKVSNALRVGLSYRSAITYDLRGHAQFSASDAYGSAVRAELTVPENASLHGIFAVTDRWDLMLNGIWTRWSRLATLTVVRTSPSATGASGSVLTSLPFEWSDSYYVALGTGYQLSHGWRLQAGVGRDGRASNDRARTARLPDQTRIQCSAGVRYQVTSRGTIDLAYTHDFIADAALDTALPGVPGRLIGTYGSTTNAISAQFSYGY